MRSKLSKGFLATLRLAVSCLEEFNRERGLSLRVNRATSNDVGCNMLNRKEIIEYFSDWKLNNDEREFLTRHASRYAILLRIVTRIVKKISATRNKRVYILDVGPHFLTELLAQSFSNTSITTLGYKNTRLYSEDHIATHLEFNLNLAQYVEKWPELQKYDLVIMAEVIEHLYTSPKLVLKYVRTLIKPNGYLLIQTPNAVAIHKRLKMLMGHNPYEMIRETVENPGHFREYTLNELKIIGKQAGLVVEYFQYNNYLIPGIMFHNAVKIITGIMRSFRQGITVVYRNQKAK